MDCLKFDLSFSYRLDGGESYEALVIALLPDVAHHFGTPRHCQRKDGIQILYFKGHILDPVTVAHQVESMLLVVRRIGGHEHEDDLVLAHSMFGKTPFTGFQSLIAKWFKSQTGGVKAGRLLGVANVECQVIKA